MKIIRYEDIPVYRFAVGKAAFLEESGARLIRNMEYSNCMLVEDGNRQVFIAAIFGRPSGSGAEEYRVTRQGEYPVRIYYEKSSYGRYGENSGIDTAMLSSEWEEIYGRYIRMAFFDPDEMMRIMTPVQRSIFESEFGWTADMQGNALEGPLATDEAAIRDFCKSSGDRLYKYLSAGTVQNNRYGVNDGELSFSKPSTFNDPFDCNCQFANGAGMDDYFHVLCMTPERRSILMWSYYAESHKGYCLEYKTRDLLDVMLNVGIKGLLVVGRVNYTKKRPKVKSALNRFSFSQTLFYIRAAFAKFEEWSHEREVRFVIMSDDANLMAQDFFGCRFRLLQVYEGCCGDGRAVKNSKGMALPVMKLAKHDTEYELVEPVSGSRRIP